MDSIKSNTYLATKLSVASVLLVASYFMWSQLTSNDLISSRAVEHAFKTDDSGVGSEEQAKLVHSGIQRNELAHAEANAFQSKDGIKAIRAALQMDRKALRSAREERDYREALQSKDLINSAVALISTVGSFTSNEDLLLNEKRRMDAVLFLTRAIEWKNNPLSREVKAEITKIVLDEAGARTDDVRLKKSLAADRIELFANLKDLDKEAGREIERQAVANPATQKILKFANNFYQLNETKKR